MWDLYRQMQDPMGDPGGKCRTLCGTLQADAEPYGGPYRQLQEIVLH